MTVRGKFKVDHIMHHSYNPDCADITLNAVYTDSVEDNSFATATPSASIQMNVSNPAAVEALYLGRSFYVDFTPADN